VIDRLAQQLLEPRGRGETVITPALLADVRSKWGARFRPQG